MNHWGGPIPAGWLLFVFGALHSPAPVSAQVLFTDVTADAGLGGVGATNFTWTDYDGDGYPDLLVGCSRLFRNGGPPDYAFTEVPSGLSGARGTWADMDNDGDLDLFCVGGTAVNAERIWRNDGGGSFTDVSDWDGDGTSNVSDGAPSMAGAWGDYDLDGFVDHYVGTYEGELAVCALDLLWKNNGDNTFTDVTTASGIEAGESALSGADPGMCARGVTWGDYDNDGDADIYVSDYRLDPNMLFENNGNGTFTEVAAARGVDGDLNGDSWGHTLGSAFFDADNDGDLDIYSGNLAHWWGSCPVLGHDISHLWRNDGAGSGYGFTDVRASSGMRPFAPDCFDDENDWEEAGPGWADWDNDTIPDIYATQFYPFRAHWGTLYRGTGLSSGVPQYADVSDPGNGDCGTGADPINETVGPTCLKRWYSWNAAWADWDRDGDLDLAVTGHDRFYQCDANPVCGDPPVEGCESVTDCSSRDSWPQPRSLWLFRNETGNQNGWLHLRLVGTAGNRSAIGARVTATAGAVTMIREVEGGHGYHSAQNDLVVEFGLGAATQADSVQIRWPSAGFPTSTFTNLAAGQRVVVYEAAEPVLRGTAPDSLPAYASTDLFPWVDPSPVLNDAVSYFYRVDDPGADIRVEKDVPAGSVRILIRN